MGTVIIESTVYNPLPPKIAIMPNVPAIISLLVKFTARIRNATHFSASKLVTDLRLFNQVFVVFVLVYSTTKLQQ